MQKPISREDAGRGPRRPGGEPAWSMVYGPPAGPAERGAAAEPRADCSTQRAVLTIALCTSRSKRRRLGSTGDVQMSPGRQGELLTEWREPWPQEISKSCSTLAQVSAIAAASYGQNWGLGAARCLSIEGDILEGAEDGLRLLLSPDSFICPMTMDSMRDPVLMSDGCTSEREYSGGWIRRRRQQRLPVTSPSTGHWFGDAFPIEYGFTHCAQQGRAPPPARPASAPKHEGRRHARARR